MNRHLAILAAVLLAAPLAAQPPAGVLFPQPFVVEHHLVQTDGDGTVFHGETVTTYYGGSWIVSVRPDESRMVIDLARRELTEIRPAAGTYWTLSYDRFGEIRDRLADLELGRAAAPAKPAPALKGAGPPEFEIVEARAALSKSLDDKTADLLASSTVRHLRVMPKAAGPENGSLDVWVDSRVRLAPAARAALARLETSVLGPPPAAAKAGAIPVSHYLAALRDHVDGDFVVRSVRPLAVAGGTPYGTLEDVATRLEPLASFPLELVEVPEGLERAVHPMEMAVAFVEQEIELKKLMGDPTAGDRKIDPR